MPFAPDVIREYDVPQAELASSNPKGYFLTSKQQNETLNCLTENKLRDAVITGFGLKPTDSYVYHAIASVSLAQAQSALDAGTSNGLCNWYGHGQNSQSTHPTESDIIAYTSIFSSTTANPGNILKSFGANAKKGSLRSSIAEYLLSKRYISETFGPLPRPSKSAIRKPLLNPYLDFWTWSCFALHWAGPEPNTVNVKMSHAVLPIFMHHFGCVVPSREALEVLKHVSLDGKKQPDTILDIGSGSGYWTYMLRALRLPVVAVDNKQSSFRCQWIDDTIFKDGTHFLNSRAGGKDDVLLLVYPVVGADFFRSMLDAYKGNRLVVVGTQCSNGYTAFQNDLVDEWITRERIQWSLELRIPVPSFAGKDEALYYFRRKA